MKNKVYNSVIDGIPGIMPGIGGPEIPKPVEIELPQLTKKNHYQSTTKLESPEKRNKSLHYRKTNS